MVGAALKGKRQNITLSSKTALRNQEAALADLDTSLRELGTDHLDIWYLHAKSKPADVTDELIDAQQTAKKAGKIRFAGVSTHSGQAELIPALIANPHIDVILTAYNFSMGQTLDPGDRRGARGRQRRGGHEGDGRRFPLAKPETSSTTPSRRMARCCRPCAGC
jgi:hypothetical protein